MSKSSPNISRYPLDKKSFLYVGSYVMMIKRKPYSLITSISAFDRTLIVISNTPC